MNFSSAQKSLKNLGGVLSRNSPAILTGLGCAGVLGTALLTGRASIKAYQILDDEIYRRCKGAKEPITNPEAFQMTWKVFIPPVLMGATSIACIIGANSINSSRNAALAALYSLSETAFREYKDKVVEEIGHNKESKVRNDIVKDRIINSPVGDKTIIITGNGNVLCYDVLSDRYFRSSAEKIRQQVLDLNYELMTDMWMDLNDLYYALGLPNNKLGSQMGFDIDKGRIEVDYSSHLTPDGEPCLAIDTTVYPRYTG